MALIDLGGFGEGGVFLDKPRYDLPPHYFTDAMNVDFTEHGVEPAVAELPILVGLKTNPIGVVYHTADEHDKLLYLGAKRAYVIYGKRHEEVTRQGALYNASGAMDSWKVCFFNGLYILCNGTDIPQVWNAKSRLFNIPNFVDTGNNYPTVAVTVNNILITLGYSSIDGSFLTNDYILWSDIADPGTLPANWNYADPTSKAGYKVMSDLGGKLITAELLGNEVFIYREQAVHVMRFIGGTYIWDISQRFDSYGVLGKNSVVNIGSRHFVVDRSKFYLHNGTSVQDVGVGVVTDRFFRELNQEALDKVLVLHDEIGARVWVCYPTDSHVNANKALIWNYRKNTWTFRNLVAVSCGTSANLQRVTYNATSVFQLGTWDDETDSWAEDMSAWNTDLTLWSDFLSWDSLTAEDIWDWSIKTLPERGIVLCKYIEAGQAVYNTSTGMSTAGDISWPGNSEYPPPYAVPYEGVRMEGSVERINLAILGQDHKGNYTVSRDIIKHLTEAYIEGESGPFEIRFGVQDLHNGAVDWDEWLVFDPDDDYKLDPNLSGRFLSYAIRSQSGSDAKWAFNGLALDIKKVGRY